MFPAFYCMPVWFNDTSSRTVIFLWVDKKLLIQCHRLAFYDNVKENHLLRLQNVLTVKSTDFFN